MPVSLARHCVELLVLGTIALGPVPWSMVLAGRVPWGPHRLLAALTAWCVLQACGALALGASGALALAPLVVVEVALGATGLAAGPAGLWGARASGVPMVPWPLAMLVGAGALAALTMGIQAAVTPITDYDSLAYHLPTMAQWVYARRIARLTHFASTIRFYPFDWEAVGTLFLLPFGEDVAVAFPNLVAWVIFGVAIHATAVTLGARPAHAAAAALLVLTTPIVREHVNTMHVDLPLAAFFLAALSFALTWQPAFCVAALGLVAGVKTSGLAYALLGVAALGVAASRRVRERAGGGCLAGAALATAGLAVGGFWYVRNAVEGGNPFAPMRLALAGRVLLPGVVDPIGVRRTTLLHLFDPARLAHWRILLAALAHQFGVRGLLVAAAAAALFLPARAAADTGGRSYRARLAALLLITAGLYWTTPYSADNGQHGWRVTPWIGQGLRFGFPFLGVLGVAASLGATRLALPDRFVAWIVAPLCMVGLTNWSLFPAAGIGALGCAARYLPARSSRIVLGTALCGLVVVGSLWLRTEREVGRRRLYGGLTEFMDKEVDRAEVIGYLLSHRSYLLQGAQIGRPVIYLEDTTGTLSEWVASLRHEGVAVVAIGPLRPWVAGAARGVLARRAWYAVRARLRAGPARRDRRLSPERRLISAVDVAHAPLC